MKNSIPDELKAIPRWVCCYADSKIPMQARQRKAASSRDPATWCDYDSALSGISQHGYSYLGWVFSADDDIIGIDIDDGYTNTGRLSDLAMDIMMRCSSYTERSKSGRGIHILVRGKLPWEGKNNRAGVECYNSGRFFIITGDRLISSDISHNQPALDYVVKTYFNTGDREATEVPRERERFYKPSCEIRGGKIAVKYPDIKPGSRNQSLTSLAGQLRTAGYDRERIISELRSVNAKRCKPPLPDREVIAITDSIMRYKRNV